MNEQSDFIYDQLKHKRQQVQATLDRSKIIKKKRTARLRSDTNVSFDEFISLLVKLVEKAFIEDGVKMSPDEGAIVNDRDEQINNPWIFFKIVDGRPTKELKPTLIEEKIRRVNEDRPDIEDPYDMYPIQENIEEEAIEVWKHGFTYHIQFDIFATSYAIANKVLKEFEELMVDYTGYLKRNGVVELLYDSRLTDQSNVQYREKYSIRSVRYTLKIDKMYVVTHKIIERLLNDLSD